MFQQFLDIWSFVIIFAVKLSRQDRDNMFSEFWEIVSYQDLIFRQSFKYVSKIWYLRNTYISLYIEKYISVIFHITISIGLLIFNAGLLAAVDVRGPLRQRRGVRQLRHAQVPRRAAVEHGSAALRQTAEKLSSKFRKDSAKFWQNCEHLQN